MDKSIGRGLAILGVLLALGMSIGAFILGVQAKQIGSAKQTITVKGVAEKPIDSTSAEWQITLNARADSFADALAQIKQEKPAMQSFLKQFGFDGEQLMFDAESVTPHMVDERDDRGYSVSVQRGFNASQTLHIKTNDLAKIQEARAKIIEYQAQGHDLDVSDVEFLVGNQDDIKLALIGEATKNAKTRADEFAKNGDAKVGSMRSASQGTFDILPANGSAEDSIGGVYDKSTVKKIARVVVTIEYNTQP